MYFHHISHSDGISEAQLQDNLFNFKSNFKVEKKIMVLNLDHDKLPPFDKPFQKDIGLAHQS